MVDETDCTKNKGRAGLMGIDKGLDARKEKEEYVTFHFSLSHHPTPLHHIQSVIVPVIIT